MKTFVRKTSKSNWKKIVHSLAGYGYIENNHFFYNQPLTIQQLVAALKKPTAEIETAFASLSIGKNETIPEAAMQEFLLEEDLDFTKLKGWNIIDSFHHWWTTPPIVKFTNRAPVIVIMGHVDHGKTTLLDKILSTNEAAQEAGAITQKLGIYTIELNQKKLTFLDTPGHHFFTLMRAQGASIADLAILVVAGNEGVRPQTKEAFEYLQSKKVPIIVFVNKNDHSDFNFPNVQNQLFKLGLVDYSSGGETPFIVGSAKQKKGFNELFKAINEITAKFDLKVPTNQAAQAVVIDWKLSSAGIETDLLITKGTINTQDYFWASGLIGKVRNLLNSQGQKIISAESGEGIVAFGMKNNLFPGQKVYFCSSAEPFKYFPDQIIKKSFSAPRVEFFAPDDSQKEQNVIIKFSGKGFEQALSNQIPKLTKKYQKLNFITVAAEEITQKDIYHAISKSAVLITFNSSLKPELARQIQQNNLIYHNFSLLHEIWEFLDRLANIAPSSKEIIVSGEFEILKIFTHSKYKFIAGGVVRSGKIALNSQPIRIYRNEKIIVENLKIHSLRSEREFVQESKKGTESGIIFENYSDFKIGDIFEQYMIKITKNEI